MFLQIFILLAASDPNSLSAPTYKTGSVWTKLVDEKDPVKVRDELSLIMFLKMGNSFDSFTYIIPKNIFEKLLQLMIDFKTERYVAIDLFSMMLRMNSEKSLEIIDNFLGRLSKEPLLTDQETNGLIRFLSKYFTTLGKNQEVELAEKLSSMPGWEKFSQTRTSGKMTLRDFLKEYIEEVYNGEAAMKAIVLRQGRRSELSTLRNINDD